MVIKDSGTKYFPAPSPRDGKSIDSKTILRGERVGVRGQEICTTGDMGNTLDREHR